MENKFNQNEYINDYKKKHYKQFRVDLKTEDMEELNVLLKGLGLTKSQFLKNAIQDLKQKKASD